MKHAFECFVICDALRADGSPARMTLAVPCEIEEVGPLPTAGEFVLSDGRRIRYRGHDRSAFLDLDSSGGGAASVQLRLNEVLRRIQATPIPTAVDGKLHRVTRRPVTDRMMDGYVRASDPVARARYADDGAIDAAASAMHAVVTRYAVVSEGRVLVRMPPPVWLAAPAHPGIHLGLRHERRSDRNGMDEFAADRTEAARAYCLAMGADPTSPWLQFGAVVFVDPAFIGSNDLVAVASRAGPFVASRLLGDLQDLPPALVTRWHDAAQASSLQPGDTWRAGEILRSVVDLIRYGEDSGNGCRLGRNLDSITDRWQWEALRTRIFEIEGIEPSPVIAGSPQGPANA
jgi:hypothetical protein